MRVKVFLHGHLKDKIGVDFVCTEARTAYEAIKSIGVRYKKVLKAPLTIGRWGVKLKDYDTQEKLMGRIRHNVLHLYPVFRTAKDAVAITVGSFYRAFISAVVGRHIWDWEGFKKDIKRGSETLSEILGMVPKIYPISDTESKYLGAAEHTTAAGTRIPLGYGKFKITGHYISYNTSSTLYVAG